MRNMLTSCTIILLSSAAFGAPPVNDDFTNATVIINYTNGVSTAIETSEASAELGESAHAQNGPFHSIWWAYTPSKNGVLELNTFDSDFDTLLAVYTGTVVSALGEIASNDQANDSGQSYLVAEAEQDITYWIAIDGFDNATGNAVLTWKLRIGDTLSPPINDDFTNATLITQNAGTSTVNTLTATAENDEPDHAAVGAFNSVWWQYMAAASGALEIDTFLSDFDTLLAVYSGSNLNSLSELKASDQYQHDQSYVLIPVENGSNYWIAVDGYFGESGDAVLRWNFSGNNDTDSDGVGDANEVIADTDPDNPNDWFHITALSNNTIFFTSSTNRLYTLLSTTNLMEPLWIPVTSDQSGSGGPDSLIDPAHIPTLKKYYQIKVSIPQEDLAEPLFIP
ncbi:hypothetical protein [Pontiella agarivorans]|uniref:Uncharacterized protein n=1 Tax=Pontiella agarivorans TaxID=3038953 RepID=A0ABU5N099_9BACT|nr:hypothetical protein [Pontiella agarivorans]MDZ8119871.1 hypothetical protein [Pontiella agarivorans]